MLPFFVMMAVLYGALNAALDTTAGERERGSLEPLLMNPAERWALVVGKWGAVAGVSMLIAVLSSLELPARRSGCCAATRWRRCSSYGPREALLFLVVLLPFAAALSAVLMAVAIRCRTLQGGAGERDGRGARGLAAAAGERLQSRREAPWHLWVPALAQNTLMTRVLKGEDFGAAQVLIPLGGVRRSSPSAASGTSPRTLRSAALQ